MLEFLPFSTAVGATLLVFIEPELEARFTVVLSYLYHNERRDNAFHEEIQDQRFSVLSPL